MNPFIEDAEESERVLRAFNAHMDAFFKPGDEAAYEKAKADVEAWTKNAQAQLAALPERPITRTAYRDSSGGVQYVE